MQKSVGKCRRIPEIRGLAHQDFQRMSVRQCLERNDEISNCPITKRDIDPLTEFLQHVDAGPPVRRIHHELHRSIWLEHIAQCLESPIRVPKMMQNPRPNNLIKALLQLVRPFNRQLSNTKILQIVFLLEFFGTAYACRAEIDTGNLGSRPTQSVLYRLGCSTTRNEDGIILPVRSDWPK